MYKIYLFIIRRLNKDTRNKELNVSYYMSRHLACVKYIKS